MEAETEVKQDSTPVTEFNPDMFSADDKPAVDNNQVDNNQQTEQQQQETELSLVPKQEQEIEQQTEVKQEPEIKEEQQQQNQDQQQKQIPAKRDYSKYDPEDQEYLRKLNNREYAVATKRLDSFYQHRKEYQEAQEKLKTASNYYDNPEAFKLTDEYKQASETFDYADFESNHYREQLVAIKSGAKVYKHLVGYNQETNEPIFKQYQMPANAANLEVDLQRNLANAERAKQETYNKVVQLRNNFGNQYKQTTTLMQNVQDHLIKQLPDDLKPDKKDVDAFLNHKNFAYFKNHPAMQLAANMYAHNVRLAAKYAKLEAAQNKNNKIAQDIKRAGPVLNGHKTTSDDANDDIVNFNDLHNQFRQ